MTMGARVDEALKAFDERLSAFARAVESTAPSPPRLPKKRLQELREIAERAASASRAIEQSFTVIDQTALDVVDMQVRLQGETARLASALKALGEKVEEQHFVREAFGDALVALDEASHDVAAAVFPSAAQGLRAVNVKLWDFQRTLWKRYTDVLANTVRRNTLTSAEQAAIERLADDVARAFDEVNALLNDLAESRARSAVEIRKRLARAPERLTRALAAAKDRMKPAFKAFEPVINASAKVADDVADLLGKLVIPIYPAHAQLGDCAPCVDEDVYEGLSGIQMFALLNILARMRGTQASGRSLVTGRNLRVFQVFPDRIYLEADRSLIDDMRADTGTFAEAPAALHRFKDGSFKQKTFRKGNLQVSFQSKSANRVLVDADIDLYRNAIPHLFGEVLVNHLTGTTTDQYAVREVLDDQAVAPIGGFALLA
jgi:ElaB/YqjD/DUF883 family membrane-anchored ribosome-binding protein